MYSLDINHEAKSLPLSPPGMTSLIGSPSGCWASRFLSDIWRRLHLAKKTRVFSTDWCLSDNLFFIGHNLRWGKALVRRYELLLSSIKREEEGERLFQRIAANSWIISNRVHRAKYIKYINYAITYVLASHYSDDIKNVLHSRNMYTYEKKLSFKNIDAWPENRQNEKKNIFMNIRRS